VVFAVCVTVHDAKSESTPSVQRNEMVTKQLEARGISSPRVLDAMRAVPRHLFVPKHLRDHAYDDNPLPIGSGQTISQPYIVAAMTELLEATASDTVLEIGTGSGYQAAVLSVLVKRVYSIEIIPKLAEEARGTLTELGYDNVVVIAGDGYRGLPEHAPFDGIIVTAAPEAIPQPLVDQLAVGARLVIPVGGGFQELMVVERTEEGTQSREIFPVRFVPMTGEAQAQP
jgi:protein-L-isoaspartate(D-aspartate) O-methyltransferase